MRVGVLITVIAGFGKQGFYNNQEVGLSKALSKRVDELILYKAVPLTQSATAEPLPGCPNTVFKQVPVRARGIHGLWDCAVMDPTLDALIYFSDTQIAVPAVYRWCKTNNVRLCPYIGVSESHSTSALKRAVIDFLFGRNIRVFQRCLCFVKTPAVGEALRKRGVRNLRVVPVGLDTALLHPDYESADPAALRQKWGFSGQERVLLFIGRMTAEKQPLRMIALLRSLRERDERYSLLMVGKGELLEAVKDAAKGLPVRFLEQVPNCDIWELYRIAEGFINLNQQEIFGMAILEAMYYGCKVVAWHAPGPDFILDSGDGGRLCGSDEEILAAVSDDTYDPAAAHRRVVEGFTWESTAAQILSAIEKET